MAAGGVYDTKYMLRHMSHRRYLSPERLVFTDTTNTNLPRVFVHLQKPEFAATVERCCGFSWPGVAVALAPGGERYKSKSFLHEAG